MALAPFPRTITGICVGFLVLCGGVPYSGAQTAPEPKPAREAPAPTPSKPETQTAPSKEAADSPAKAIQALPLKQRAWLILHDGAGIDNTDKRAKAIKALGLLTGNTEAEKLATAALKDEKGDVRAAAATALGNMHAARAKQVLEAALDDSEPAVVLASANSLLLLKDADFAYDVYYGVLTGTVRTNKGVVREQIRDQMKILHDKKKIAELGLEQGVGFIPYGGLGYGMVKTMVKSDNSLMRAAAAKKLAHDPDPASAKALVAATQDKNWLVRVAALEAISERGDRSLAAKVAPSLDDDKDEVRFTGAACIAHLSALPLRPRSTVPTVSAAANPNAGN
jgi:HEAT repeats